MGAGILVAGGAALGGALAAAGVVWLAVALAGLQPALDRSLGGAGMASFEQVQDYARRVAAVEDPTALARDLAATVRAMGIAKGALLMVPDETGEGVRILGEGAEQVLALDAAFELIGAEGFVTAEVARADATGGPEARAILELLGANALIALRHRDLLVGVAAFQGLDFAKQELGARLGRASALAFANSLLVQAASGKRTLKQVLSLANVVQETLMPGDRVFRHGDFAIRGVFRPVAECGGDFWAWYPLGPGRVLAVIGDVTGHGAPAAMITASVKGCVDAVLAEAGGQIDPAELLVQMNRAVYQVGRTQWLMTAFAAVCDVRTGELEFANAGQNFPYLVTPAGAADSKLQQLVARGNALGAVASTRFTTQRRPMGPTDCLVLYTDGLVDQANVGGEPYGDKRMRAVLAAPEDDATVLPDRLLSDFARHVGQAKVGDDITLVVVAAEGRAEEGRGL
jgi:serine phosphatase RsbU (regulator of sigma subunit)